MQFQCPRCQARFQIEDAKLHKYADKPVPCPACRNAITLTQDIMISASPSNEAGNAQPFRKNLTLHVCAVVLRLGGLMQIVIAVVSIVAFMATLNKTSETDSSAAPFLMSAYLIGSGFMSFLMGELIDWAQRLERHAFETAQSMKTLAKTER